MEVVGKSTQQNIIMDGMKCGSEDEVMACGETEAED